MGIRNLTTSLSLIGWVKTMVVKLSMENVEEVVGTALTILKKGGIIAYPTETYYGLGVKYDIEPALEKVFEIKGRPQEKALPLIVRDLEQLSLLAESISPIALELIKRFWPGPLTLLFKARKGLPQYIVFEDRVAARMPGQSFALRLIRASEFPITATSANVSTMPPASIAPMVVEYFGERVDLVVDGGRTGGGFPSTIVDTRGEKIEVVREGVIPAYKIEGLR